MDPLWMQLMQYLEEASEESFERVLARVEGDSELVSFVPFLRDLRDQLRKEAEPVGSH